MTNLTGAFTADNLSYLFGGFMTTIGVSLFSIVISLVVGSIIGILLFEKIPYFSSLLGTLNNIVRNLPLLLIIFFSYFAFPELGIRLPVFWSTVCALSFFEASMIAEIVRGGLKAVDVGQFEGAASVGMTRAQALWHIVLPQAYQKMIPPLISQLISLVKDTSLASGIVLADLTYRGQMVYAQDSRYIVPILLLLTFGYFLFNHALSKLADYCQKRLA
ncbi:amino acid ABC transporter permease [Fructobacillus sp. W13]|uniref:Amino acid ABC transporter permease n=2 Tax=Fructobacillus apis TaxID=2935017 RepID=A0ABT0ZPY2_9LACO|nr:amino acid ABC transporter permease [Fructobacillus apis]MCO0832056.1 amino acid ABC transporter permease [Fructobacillus apis]